MGIMDKLRDSVNNLFSPSRNDNVNFIADPTLSPEERKKQQEQFQRVMAEARSDFKNMQDKKEAKTSDKKEVSLQQLEKDERKVSPGRRENAPKREEKAAPVKSSPTKEGRRM